MSLTSASSVASAGFSATNGSAFSLSLFSLSPGSAADERSVFGCAAKLPLFSEFGELSVAVSMLSVTDCDCSVELSSRQTSDVSHKSSATGSGVSGFAALFGVSVTSVQLTDAPAGESAERIADGISTVDPTTSGASGSRSL